MIGGALGVLLAEQSRLVRMSDNAPERRLAECPSLSMQGELGEGTYVLTNW